MNWEWLPGWGRFDEPSWWWEYGLDGLMGGVIGGVVTGVAVWLTLRHERRQSELAEARSVALQVQSVAWRAGKAVQANPEDVNRWTPVMHELNEQALLFSSVTSRRWPAAHREVDGEVETVNALLREIPRSPHEDAIIHALAGVGASASTWMMEPKKYRKRRMRLPARRGRRS